MSFHPIPGETFTFNLPGLEDQANPGLWKSNPTIAAGDFIISINSGATDSLDNTPTVKPAGGTQIEIVLSAAETTAAGDGGSITVNCVDAAGDEWYSVGVTLRVGYPSVNVTYSAGVALSGRLAEAADLPSEPLDATATQAAAAAALTAYDPPTKTEMDAGFTALNDLDAAGIRLAVGLATANLDMQLSTIDGIVDDLALVAPDNKPIVNVDGETLAYMTALSEEEIAAAVVVALQETPVEVICITPQPSQESDYDILRNNATNC